MERCVNFTAPPVPWLIDATDLGRELINTSVDAHLLASVRAARGLKAVDNALIGSQVASRLSALSLAGGIAGIVGGCSIVCR
jgi:hypothetical protein